MSYSVIISSMAETDLRAVYEYIALVLGSAENAEAQLSRLEDRIRRLDELPKRYRSYKRNIRIMPVDNYLVFYSVDDEAKRVSVLRVMYGRRDLSDQV